jgi:hypothetical protein
VLWSKWGAMDVGVVMCFHRGLSGFDGRGFSVGISVSEDVIILASCIV